ncbi:DNA-binding response regulator [Bacillus sp. FJAT-27225]|uniref:response regulator transcription factor n=1 Tax=Bacillus sp. FJAT-27225 TaxID=1743144 RepID=UPI00080C3139|nr:response regulator transcription factor [Bacillus sp. FJAT-27225]OCA83272.1 DNA-binding response regulator [Bacillus sp. FJAT-27225]
MPFEIAIVDDDKKIVDLIGIYLTNEGFNVHKAYDGNEALSFVKNDSVDLLILDVMMPGRDGLEVCREIRKKSTVPILMLSAKVEDIDKIHGLMTGADDYMVKPFNPLELTARVKALLRRATILNRQHMKADSIFIDSLEINKATHTAKIGEMQVKLTSLEFAILYLLASNRGRVFSTEDIFENVWQEDGFGAAKTVMVHISNLREKLSEATGNRSIIQTVWGVGYKIE